MASVALSCFGQWVCSFQIIPKNAVDAASRIRKAQNLPRHRLACAVVQVKIRAHWECKERRMREAGDISKCCLRKVLKCGRTKPLGLFVKAILVAHKYEAPAQAELLPSIQSSSFDIKC